MNITEKAKSRIKFVLLIDDDNAAQFMNRCIIEDLHVVDKCIEHYNGATALQMLLQEQTTGLSLPEVILLDLHMPEMDGLEFLQELTERGALSLMLKRTIVLSSSTHAKDVAKVKMFGVRWYLMKPLLIEDISPILTILMQEREREREIKP